MLRYLIFNETDQDLYHDAKLQLERTQYAEAKLLTDLSGYLRRNGLSRASS